VIELAIYPPGRKAALFGGKRTGGYRITLASICDAPHTFITDEGADQRRWARVFGRVAARAALGLAKHEDLNGCNGAAAQTPIS